MKQSIVTLDMEGAPLLRQLYFSILLGIHEQKRELVAAFTRLNFQVIVADGSCNDTAMLKEPNVDCLIHARENAKKEFPQSKAVESRSALLHLIKGSL